MARDSIELALSSQPAPDVRHILPVVISYYAAHSNVSSQLWKNKGKGLIALVRRVLSHPVGSGADTTGLSGCVCTHLFLFRNSQRLQREVSPLRWGPAPCPGF